MKQMPPQQLEEEKQSTGHLRVQVIEESKSEVFMASKVDDPVQRIQMAIELRKSKKQELLSKKRHPAYQDQSFAHAPEEFYEFPDGANDQHLGLDEELEILTME